jgi:hypothetical protein
MAHGGETVNELEGTRYCPDIHLEADREGTVTGRNVTR